MPMSGSWPIGLGVAGAAALAVERVNADVSAVPRLSLEYSWADSGCSVQQGLKAMGELLGGSSSVDAVIAPGCSSGCEATSYLAGGQGLPQLSYSCTAILLSNKDEHPLVSPLCNNALVDFSCVACHLCGQFSRTVAPDTSKGPALIAFMQHNRWRKIAMVCSSDTQWFETRQGLTKQLETAGIEVLRPAAFESGNFKDQTINKIRRSGIRIVLLIAFPSDLQVVASLSQREKMTAGWAWLLTADYTDGPTMAG